jgi:hypothetical protein
MGDTVRKLTGVNVLIGPRMAARPVLRDAIPGGGDREAAPNCAAAITVAARKES